MIIWAKNSENIEIEHVFQSKAFFHLTSNLHTSCFSAFNEQTDCLTITDKKSSIQENKRTKDIKKKKQKQANDNAYINNRNKIKKWFIYSETAWPKSLTVIF